VIIALAVWLLGIPPAFLAGLWLVAAAVRAGVFHMPWWGVVLAAAGIAVAWPWGLYSFVF
jgi:hypothetical protein